jgi:predicted secreted protein
MKTKILFTLFVISFLSGCSDSTSPTETYFDSSVNGKYISVNSKNKFILEIDVSADAGFRWDYTINNTKIIEVDSVRFKPKNPDVNVCGGVTIQTIYFKAIQPGRSKVYLYEHQPWEEDTPPIKTITFNVRIK